MIWSDPRWVTKTPIVTTLLLEGANVGQLWRIWTEGTAEGQSLVGWCLVWVALVLWWNFYRVVTPDQRTALWATAFGVLMNSLVIASVVYWRFFV